MKPLNYSIPQRVVHWGTALLIFFNLIFTDGMEAYHHALRRHEDTTDLVSGANIHAYVGIAILVLAVLRIILRITQGAPEMPADEPVIAKFAAAATHGLIYLLLLSLPISGMAAYYFNIGVAGDLHADVLKTVLWALLVLHIAAALIHKFVWKTDVMDRMTKGVRA